MEPGRSMTTQTYHAASRKFLAQARGELVAGDLPQASEKGWGAAAQIVKAVAESRGWDHMTHRHLFRAVDRLRDETGDSNIRRFFDSASVLHVNFYEDWKDAQSVHEGIDDVEQLLNLLEPLT